MRQQYLDFLNREPDPNGLSFWSNEITSCGSDLNCIEVKRINVSAAFFLSIEFQQTGYFVDRLYLTSFARTPNLREFWPDSRQISAGVIVNSPGWEQVSRITSRRSRWLLCNVRNFSPLIRLRCLPINSSTNSTRMPVMCLRVQRAQLVSLLGATPADSAKRASALRSVAGTQSCSRERIQQSLRSHAVLWLSAKETPMIPQTSEV